MSNGVPLQHGEVEGSELTTFCRHTKYIATRGIIPSERNPNLTEQLIHQGNEKNK